MRQFLFLIVLIPLSGFSQRASGGGIFPEHAKARTKILTKTQINYSDNTAYDTLVISSHEFDEHGRMIKEFFMNAFNMKVSYSYSYNDQGFLTRIDTNGLFGYGSASCGADSTYYSSEIKYLSYGNLDLILSEKWIYPESNYKREITYEYNKFGQLIMTTSLLSSLEDKLISCSISKKSYNSDGLIKEEINLYSEELKEPDSTCITNRIIYSYQKW